jgi:hypothetical protein
MRANYRELPRIFAFMTSMPPPHLRIYILEATDPDWVGHNERVQQVYTNVHIPSQNQFSIYPHHRFHPEKNLTNLQLYTHHSSPRIVYEMEWWDTGFYLQNNLSSRELQEIPILDFESRLLQDLLFEQGRAINLIHTSIHTYDEFYREIFDRRIGILTLFDRYDNRGSDTSINVRRRISFSLQDLQRPQTPPRRRHYEGDYYSSPRRELEIPRPPRDNINIIRRPRNVIIQPAGAGGGEDNRNQRQAPFTIPKFVIEAILDSFIKSEKACSITMVPFKDVPEISVTSCYHCFEKEALTRWMAENQTCPECRTTINGVFHHKKETV